MLLEEESVLIDWKSVLFQQILNILFLIVFCCFLLNVRDIIVYYLSRGVLGILLKGFSECINPYIEGW